MSWNETIADYFPQLPSASFFFPLHSRFFYHCPFFSFVDQRIANVTLALLSTYVHGHVHTGMRIDVITDMHTGMHVQVSRHVPRLAYGQVYRCVFRTFVQAHLQGTRIAMCIDACIALESVGARAQTCVQACVWTWCNRHRSGLPARPWTLPSTNDAFEPCVPHAWRCVCALRACLLI